MYVFFFRKKHKETKSRVTLSKTVRHVFQLLSSLNIDASSWKVSNLSLEAPKKGKIRMTLGRWMAMRRRSVAADLLGNKRPHRLQAMHWIWLKSWNDGLQRREILKNPHFLRKIMTNVGNNFLFQWDECGNGTWAMPIHLVMIFDRSTNLGWSYLARTVVMTLSRTALNWLMVASTEDTLTPLDLSRFDRTEPRQWNGITLRNRSCNDVQNICYRLWHHQSWGLL